MRWGRWAGICIILVAGVGSAPGKTLHVGSKNPYRSIQVAIDAAAAGDKIDVGPGTYRETVNFHGKAVHLSSQAGPAITIIDGSGHYHAVLCENGEGHDTVLEGFTITGGNRMGSEWGGGMYNSLSSPTVINCVFIDNGGYGMFNEWGQSQPVVINCTFADNAGDGIQNDGGGPLVEGCVFRDNAGNGMRNDEAGSPRVSDCLFTGNAGDGMRNGEDTLTRVTNCLFVANAGAGMRNWCLFNWPGYGPAATNCVFSANGGHGMDNWGMDGSATHCTFVANAGAGMYNRDSRPVVTSCIFWYNAGGPIGGDPGIVTCSAVAGGWPGAGNISADPLFAALADGDYHLAPDSPCIDAGTNDPPEPLPPTDVEGRPRCVDGDGDRVAVPDMGAYEAPGKPRASPPRPQ